MWCVCVDNAYIIHTSTLHCVKQGLRGTMQWTRTGFVLLRSMSTFIVVDGWMSRVVDASGQYDDLRRALQHVCFGGAEEEGKGDEGDTTRQLKT